MSPRKIGILGYGSLGIYLKDAILKSDDFELSFVWNRTAEKLGDVPKNLRITNIEEAIKIPVDLVVEVAHPEITKRFGVAFLQNCDYVIGSPTALASEEVLHSLRKACLEYGHSVYVPSGAFWGGEDIRKMADLDTLKALTVSMTKHPTSFRLESPLAEINLTVGDEPIILYEGPVRLLCEWAPNNVNTMAAACIAAHTLGFDYVKGILISDSSCIDQHIVEVYVEGRNGFSVTTMRKNPAQTGAVTGSATYHAFLASIRNARNKGPGIHLC